MSSFGYDTVNLSKKIEEECVKNVTTGPDDGQYGNAKFCQPVYDGIMCWSKTEAGKTATQACSSSIYQPSFQVSFLKR